MNKSEFIARLQSDLPYDKEEVEFLFNVLENILKDGLLSDGRVKTPIGTFKTKIRKSRRIVDISTKKERILPERTEVVFAPNKQLKEDVNNG